MSRRLIALLILLCFHSYSYGSERAVMRVFLNNQEKGDFFCIMADGGRLLFSPGDMLAIGLQRYPKGLKPERMDMCISIPFLLG